DVAQDVIVREEDCGTDRGLNVSELSVGAELIEPLFDRLVGRTVFEDIIHPETNEEIATTDDVLTEDQSKQIVESAIEEVTIRYAVTCNTKQGVCKKCYGRNLATGADVVVGEEVGIIAAEAIG